MLPLLLPPGIRVCGLSRNGDEELAREGGEQSGRGSGAEVLSRESDLCRNDTHGGDDDDPPSYAAAVMNTVMV